MNIFFLDKDPYRAALALCDKHIPKMLLESCQMLSTAVRRYEEDTGTAPLQAPIYKSAYKNHPMTRWVGETRGNFKWALENAVYINHQYEQRFNKDHKSFAVIENIYNFDLDAHIPDGTFTTPPQCMPDEYKHKNYVTAYRQYYVGAKTFAKWEKGVFKPEWYEKIKNKIETLKEKTRQASLTRTTNQKGFAYSS